MIQSICFDKEESVEKLRNEKKGKWMISGVTKVCGV